MRRPKHLLPLSLALAGGAFLVALSLPQFVGGVKLLSQERTLDNIAGGLYTRPLSRDELAIAVSSWQAAAPLLDDSDVWTDLGNVLLAWANTDQTDAPARYQTLQEAVAAYRRALEIGPANARAWTMLAAARLEIDATPDELMPLLNMSLRTGPREPSLVLTRLDIAFFIWRVLDPALQVAMQDQVLLAAQDNPRQLAAVAHRHFLLGPVRDMLEDDRVLKWRFDDWYSRDYP